MLCTKSISLYFFHFFIFSSFMQRELPPFEFKQLLDKCPSAFDPYSICYFLMLYEFSRSIKPHRKATEIQKEILIKRFQKEALNDSITTITLHWGNKVFFFFLFTPVKSHRRCKAALWIEYKLIEYASEGF